MRIALHAGWIAALLFLVALLAADAFGPAPGRMLAASGASDVGFAPLWNVAGFALPGLLVAAFALALETPMRSAGARRGGRIGSTLLLLSGLFFAAQGVLPYDFAAPDETASQLHVAALSLSLIAFLPAAAFIGASLRRALHWQLLRTLGGVLAAAVLLCVAFPVGLWLPALQGEPGLAQRMVLTLYFGWIALAAGVALHASRPRTN